MRVLDKGFVDLLETFGDDLTVVNAARVSFGKEVHSMSEADEKLIKYLASHNHITPFFHPQVRMRIKMPIFVAREWFRHQIGFARNEISRRYVDSEPECYMPSVIRERDSNVKQGSKLTSVSKERECLDLIDNANSVVIDVYKALLTNNVAPELARTVLPQGMFTEFIETGSLAAYARLCQLRLDPSAQWEIREYAAAVSELLALKFPVSWTYLAPSVPSPAAPAAPAAS